MNMEEDTEDITIELIMAIRARVKLVDLVAECTQLVRSKQGYKGSCPFEKCKSDRFFVNTKKDFYGCYGCGESGDIFAFVERTKGVKFLNAVRYLAEKHEIAPET